MGCFSYSCSISGLPIEYQDCVIYLALCKAGDVDSHGIGVNHAWEPATVPLRGHYNDYGSVDDLEESASTRAFFDSLARRAIERPVGENRIHDVPVTPSSMTREEWLMALWEDRVQIHPPTVGLRSLAQTMVRRDVWDFLVNKVSSRVEKVGDIQSRYTLGLNTQLDRTDLNNPELARDRFELCCLQFALSEVGRPWARGTCCGPQFPAWNFQAEFVSLLSRIVRQTLDQKERESGERYEDD